jgi:hypothetical protein
MMSNIPTGSFLEQDFASDEARNAFMNNRSKVFRVNDLKQLFQYFLKDEVVVNTNGLQVKMVSLKPQVALRIVSSAGIGPSYSYLVQEGLGWRIATQRTMEHTVEVRVQMPPTRIPQNDKVYQITNRVVSLLHSNVCAEFLTENEPDIQVMSTNPVTYLTQDIGGREDKIGLFTFLVRHNSHFQTPWREETIGDVYGNLNIDPNGVTASIQYPIDPTPSDFEPIFWQEGTFNIFNEESKTITFQSPFDQVPFVFVEQIDGQETYSFSPFEVTNNSFSLKFGTEINSGSYQYFAGYVSGGANVGQLSASFATANAILAQSTILGSTATFQAGLTLNNSTNHKVAWLIQSGSEIVMPVQLSIDGNTLVTEFSSEGIQSAAQLLILDT